MEELTVERRRRWISAISRGDLTDFILENDRVCSGHFVSGKAAKDWDRFNADWAPTLCLGHSKKQSKDPEGVAQRAQRAAERRKRPAEAVEKELEEKRKNMDESGEKIEEVLFTKEETLFDEDLDLSRETTSVQANCEIEDQNQTSIDLEQTVVDAETQTENPERKVETENAAIEIADFEHLFKESVVQPFTEEYFVDNEDRVQFYTGLPGFYILKAAFGFVSPFVTRRIKTLTLFQEFVMVLMKLRLNVPLQDVDFRFNVSLLTVSRTFTA